MADLDVQPKKRSGAIWPWILLALGVLALIWYFMRDRNDNDRDNAAAVTTDSATMTNTTANTAAGSDAEWNNVDFNAPAVRYNEVSDRDIDVRGNDQYGIYGVGEDILFDVDKATIRKSGEAKLKQIAASISQRYNNSNVRVYGYTDSTGSASYNKDLAAQRAEAVRNWLVQQGNIAADRLSVHPVGEANPEATNSTAAGRQQNRRVEIVARNMNGTGAANDSSTNR